MSSETSRPLEGFTSGAAYEPWIGRWSRLVAREFVPWMAVPPGGRWLDVGCGTGALTQTILALARPSLVKGIDRSEAYVAYAREKTKDERAIYDVGDGQALAEPSASYDAAVAGLSLNFIPEPAQAAREMTRVVRSIGTVGAYVWDYVGGMQFLRAFWDAATALDPAAGELDQGQRFAICQPEPLARLFRDAGLREVEVRAIDIPTVFRDFDDYWLPFLGGQGSAPTYLMSLSEERRVALREHLRGTVSTAADGSIQLTARAWAVRGRR
jgi:SAM-dependent methyltransferase